MALFRLVFENCVSDFKRYLISIETRRPLGNCEYKLLRKSSYLKFLNYLPAYIIVQ